MNIPESLFINLIFFKSTEGFGTFWIAYTYEDNIDTHSVIKVKYWEHLFYTLLQKNNLLTN